MLLKVFLVVITVQGASFPHAVHIEQPDLDTCWKVAAQQMARMAPRVSGTDTKYGVGCMVGMDGPRF